MAETIVCIIEWDVERFQAYLYDLPDDELSLERHMEFVGRSVLEGWEPLPVYSDQPRLEQPNIWYQTETHMPVLSAAVVDELEPFVSRSGELLPLVVSRSDETVYLLNVLQVRDALEPHAYSFWEERFEPQFIEHRLPDTGLFLLPHSRGDIFHVDRDNDQESLRRRIMRLGLRGMEFLPVWSSTEGPLVQSLIEPVPIAAKTVIPQPPSE